MLYPQLVLALKNRLSLRHQLYCDITQCIMVIPYRRFGKLTGPIFKGNDSDQASWLPSWFLNRRNGTDSLSRNVGYELWLYAAEYPDECRSRLLCGGSLKSQIQFAINWFSGLRCVEEWGFSDVWRHVSVPTIRMNKFRGYSGAFV